MSHDHSHHDHTHGQDHGQGHGHHHAHHDHGAGSNERRLLLTLILTAGFMVVEFITGWWAGSLALIADAGHMLTDAVSLALAFFAIRISRKPADTRRSYGYDRMQVLAAFVNGLTLFALSLWIVVESITRLINPVPIQALPMLIVGALGFGINLLCFAILHGGAHDNLNLRGAVAHVLSDLLGSVGAVLAALAILYGGWTIADPLFSALMAVLILRTAWNITRQSAHVLLEGAPDGFNVAALESELAHSITGIRNIHHVHVWMLSPDKRMLTLHAQIEAGADADAVTHAINAYLQQQHGIAHATIQIERGPCAGTHHTPC